MAHKVLKTRNFAIEKLAENIKKVTDLAEKHESRSWLANDSNDAYQRMSMEISHSRQVGQTSAHVHVYCTWPASRNIFAPIQICTRVPQKFVPPRESTEEKICKTCCLFLIKRLRNNLSSDCISCESKQDRSTRARRKYLNWRQF